MWNMAHLWMNYSTNAHEFPSSRGEYWPVSRWLKKDVDLQYLIHKSPQILYTVHMEVSWNGGTPQIIHFNGIFHYKQSISGYHHLWKPPYIDSISHGIYLDASICDICLSILVRTCDCFLIFRPQKVASKQAPCLDITWEVEITHEVGWMAWNRSSGMSLSGGCEHGRAKNWW
jgi:hypothetical protein